MSKYDDYVQSAEETEYQIEEERERWDDWVRWEEWINTHMPTTDQGGSVSNLKNSDSGL